jgi:hypothetical protein
MGESKILKKEGKKSERSKEIKKEGKWKINDVEKKKEVEVKSYVNEEE